MTEHLTPYVEKGKRLLELGCGSGKHTFRAEELGLSSTGIDCSEGMLNKARRFGSESGMNAKFVFGDYTDMPFNEDAFDYALFPFVPRRGSFLEFRSL